MQTFFCDDDYGAYLGLLRPWCGRYGVEVLAYCLMPNHVHMILVPSTAEGLARAVGETNRRYTRRINFRENWRGYLWQGRFASFVMDDSYLVSAAAYMERNPVKAGLVDAPEQWPWSSAAAHVAGRGDAVAAGDWLTEMTAGWVCTWEEYLAQDADKDLVGRLARHESTGRPLGDTAFIKRVGKLLGRDLTIKKGGRPRKHPAKRKTRTTRANPTTEYRGTQYMFCV